MDTETLLLAFIGVSVSLLLIMLMITMGDQYSRFGAVLRCALSSAILVVAAIYNLPGYLNQAYGLSVAATGVLWVSFVVGAVALAVAAVHLFIVWLRWGEGDELPPSAQRETRDDPQDSAERKQA